MNDQKMRAILGRAPNPMERPSCLNALAFKCGARDCPNAHCLLQLDEVNVMQLRQAWSCDLVGAGYSDHANVKGPVLNTLIQHCTSGVQHPSKFGKIAVSIMDRRGKEVWKASRPEGAADGVPEGCARGCEEEESPPEGGGQEAPSRCVGG